MAVQLPGEHYRRPVTCPLQPEGPAPSEQKPGCGFPVMSVSGLLNLSHGG